MRKYYKSKTVLYFYLVVFLFFFSGGIICLFKLNTTKIQLGFDLFGIFAAYFFLSSIPSLYRIIYFFVRPNIVMTIYPNYLIIHYRNRNLTIDISSLFSVTLEYNGILKKLNSTFGNLKILVNNQQRPIRIKYVEDVEMAYQTLQVVRSKNDTRQFNSFV